MPKKRKTTKRSVRGTKKEAPVTHELPGGWWRQIVAVLLVALSIFFVFTWTGHGGDVLNTIHAFLLSGIGFAVYFIPALLIYIAVKIFRSENNRVALPVYFAATLLLLWVSGISANSGNGGAVGKWLNDLMLNLLDQTAVIFIYVVLILITALFLFQLSPLTFFKGTRNLVRPSKKADPEADENSKKPNKKFGQLEIKVNSGMNAEAGTKAGKPLTKRFLHKTPTKEPVATAEAPKEPTALVVVNDADWKAPSLDLLEKKQSPPDGGNIQQNAMIIRNTLAEYGINVEMEGANVGPRITQYTMKPPAGIALSKILARDKELALNLAVDKVRIEAPIPGTSSVGVELPNVRTADVRLRAILESPEWKKDNDPLTFAVGKDISGKPVVANLGDMRHLLVAGMTGSGKSVMTNVIITSLLFRNSPSELKLIIIDPKQVEMAQYNNVPHLLAPIITEPDKSLSAMKWAVGEMERRYSVFSEELVKNIADYNTKISKSDDPEKGSKMPYIVIVVDEMADIMMTAGKDLEVLISRIAQKGRAAGMHLILATQRPEAKVITGLIKSNVPGRIAFAVGSNVDSRIIIDQSGAEKLLGKGDMLLMTTGTKPRRIQGAWAPDGDIEKVTDFLRAQRAPEYNEEVISQQVSIKGMDNGAGGGLGEFGRRFDPNDPLVRRAVELSIEKGKFSTSMLQAHLSKGHGFVAGLAIWFEEIGVIGQANGTKPRDVLISSLEEFDELANL